MPVAMHQLSSMLGALLAPPERGMLARVPPEHRKCSKCRRELGLNPSGTTSIDRSGGTGELRTLPPSRWLITCDACQPRAASRDRYAGDVHYRVLPPKLAAAFRDLERFRTPRLDQAREQLDEWARRA